MAVQRAQAADIFAGLDPSIAKMLDDEKNQEPKPDIGDTLPPGINNGVGQLKECRFMHVKEGKQNAGKLQFYAMAVAVEPKYHKGIPVGEAGIQFRFIEALYDTPNNGKTAQDHFRVVQDWFKKMGFTGESVTLKNLEKTAKLLTERKPHFRFRTWIGAKLSMEQIGNKFVVSELDPETGEVIERGGKPLIHEYRNETEAKAAHPFVGNNPTTRVNWLGAFKYAPNVNPTAGVNGPAVTSQSAFTTQSDNSENSQPAAASDSELEALVVECEASDINAQNRLRAVAMGKGISQEVLDKDEITWRMIKDMIEEAGETPAAEPETTPAATATETVAGPEVGSMWKWAPPGAKKAITVEVISSADGKCNVASSVNPKNKWNDVPWGALKPAQ